MKKLILSSAVALLSVSAFAQNKAETIAQENDVPTPPAEVTENKAECRVTIEANDQMQYNLKEFTIDKEKCSDYTVELEHVGKMPANSMGHNVVIAQTADVGAIAKDGITANDTDHIKPGDERVIAHTKMLGGGEKDEVTFSTADLQKDGDYSFFCSYPGHYAMMQGKVIVK